MNDTPSEGNGMIIKLVKWLPGVQIDFLMMNGADSQQFFSVNQFCSTRGGGVSVINKSITNANNSMSICQFHNLSRHVYWGQEKLFLLIIRRQKCHDTVLLLLWRCLPRWTWTLTVRSRRRSSWLPAWVRDEGHLNLL
jgi:hypothetical protein